MAAYRLTPARRAALKKAQIASARKRKGTGKRRSPSNRRRNAKRAALAVGAVAAAAGAGYVYKNRERMIIAPAAEMSAVRRAKSRARKQGKRLGKAQIRKVRLEERRNHASRSTYRVREYQMARKAYKTIAPKGLTLRPGQKNSVSKAIPSWQREKYMYDTYRKDVNVRARHRLDKLKGKRTTGFSYKSGKTRLVVKGAVIRMPF